MTTDDRESRFVGDDSDADAILAWNQSPREAGPDELTALRHLYGGTVAPESAADPLDAWALLEAFTGTVRDVRGHERHYVNGKQVKSRADVDKAGGGETRTLPADAPSPDKVWTDIEANLTGDVAANPSLKAKARAYFSHAYNTVFTLSAEWGPELAPEILDTAQDFESIKYAKAGPQGQDVNDPFAVHFGVPYSVISGVLSRVIAAAYGHFAKGRAAAEAEEADRPREIAEQVARLFAELHGNIPGVEPPTASEILARMAERERAGVGEAPPAPPAG